MHMSKFIEMLHTQKNETGPFLPKMISTCSLAVHACDLEKKCSPLILNTFGGNSNNTYIGW